MRRLTALKRNSKGRFVETTGSTRYNRKTKNGKNHQEHRLIWEAAHGEIPAGHVIHHINGDGKDNRIDNLDCVSYTLHNRIHKHPAWNKGKKCPQISKSLLGHPVTEQQIHRQKTTWKKKYIESMRQIYVLFNNGLSYNNIAEQHGLTQEKVANRYRKYVRDYLEQDVADGQIENMEKIPKVAEEDLAVMKKIDAMREENVAWSEISKTINIPASTVRYKHRRYLQYYKGQCLQKVETYSRVVGYFRPLMNWNIGKKQEFKDRIEFNAEKSMGGEAVKTLNH